MRKPIQLNTWEDFERELVTINERTTVLQQEGKLSSMEYPIFRGVKNAEYHLESTLDRIKKEMKLSDYITIVEIVRDYVATCTGRKWDLETKEPKIFGGFNLPLSAYEFMVYLRHHGFPSPLIDWTKSPYIAAFFAFGDVYSKAEHASIFVHRGDVMCGESPSIWRLGSSIKTFRTHFLQQSEYSICRRREDGGIYFANHEDVEDDEGEDILVKYKIPVSERQKVLKKLDSMNITAYSLFDSEPSLMETLALREIVFEMKD